MVGLRGEDTSVKDQFLLAMVQHRLGQRARAQTLFEQARERWSREIRSQEPTWSRQLEVQLFEAEAGQLIGK